MACKHERARYLMVNGYTQDAQWCPSCGAMKEGKYWQGPDRQQSGVVMTMWTTGPPPAKGQFQRYPGRFWYNFKKQYPITDDMKVLHMFSGSMDWGDTTDMREETGAMVVAPYDELPISSDTYDLVVADPPYTCGFANEWIEHPKDLPKPKRILIEAARVTKPGGIIAIMHVILVPAYKVAQVSRIGLHGILCGPNNAIRLLNVFRKAGPVRP